MQANHTTLLIDQGKSFKRIDANLDGAISLARTVLFFTIKSLLLLNSPLYVYSICITESLFKKLYEYIPLDIRNVNSTDGSIKATSSAVLTPAFNESNALS